jgi:hypothetical protein
VKAAFGSLPVPVFLLSAAVAAWALALIRLINYGREGDAPTFDVTMTAYDPLTGEERWTRALGAQKSRLPGFASRGPWYLIERCTIQSFHAMADERRVYVPSYVHAGRLDAYDLENGHLLWSTPDILPPMRNDQPLKVIEGVGTLNFWDMTLSQWQIVNRADGTVRTEPGDPRWDQHQLQTLFEHKLFGDTAYLPSDSQPVVYIKDIATGLTTFKLPVDGPPDKAVRIAVGALDDGQPVLITYAGGVLRGWLRGP